MAGQVATRARRIADELKGLAVTLGVMLLAGTAIGQPFIVPSGSMEPTLMIGDEIAAAKYAYGYGRYSSPVGVIPLKGRILERPPERGDIVVFALPRDPAQTYVKRVIGLPGDRIQMKGGLLFINGAEVPRRQVGPVTMTVGGSRVRGMKYRAGGQLLHDGRQPRQLARQPRRPGGGRRRIRAGGKSHRTGRPGVVLDRAVQQLAGGGRRPGGFAHLPPVSRRALKTSLGWMARGHPACATRAGCAI